MSTIINYKRGEVTYNVQGFGSFTEKVWDVFINGKKELFVEYDSELREWFAYPDTNSDYVCGGLTLREIEETIARLYEQIQVGETFTANGSEFVVTKCNEDITWLRDLGTGLTFSLHTYEMPEIISGEVLIYY